MAQGPRPGAVAPNRLLDSVILGPDSRAPGQSPAQREVYLTGTARTRQCFGASGPVRPASGIMTADCIMVCRRPGGPRQARWPACSVTPDRDS